MKRDKLYVLSAFTGAGGLDLGFEAAGFDVVTCIERNRWAQATLRANRPSWQLSHTGEIEEAATTLSPSDLGLKPGELAAIIAGPPCQPFSKAAQWASTGRFGMNDPRASCLLALLKLVEKFLPRVLFIENVAGFSSGPLAALPVLARELCGINKRSGAGYCLLGPFTANAADFGVPQKRQRSFLVAIRGGTEFVPPVRTHENCAISTWDAIGELRGATKPEARGKWRDLLPSIPEGQNYLWHTPRGGGLPLFGYRTRYWSFLLKLEKRSPSWTLSAAPGPSTGPFHWENRPLTIEEASRLQTFPVEWKFAGSYREQMRQAGNATPPLLAEHFARALGWQVFAKKYANDLAHAISRRGDVPLPEEISPVPAKYLLTKPAYLAHPGVGRGPKPTGNLRQRSGQRP